MKSIRNLTMGTKEEEPTYPTKQASIPYDDQTDYNNNYPNPSNSKDHSTTETKEYKISMIINNDEIGDIANESDIAYDELSADNKSLEIAYDRIEKLLGKGYESKYSISFKSFAGYSEYEIEATLIPIK